mmetsp:Transcript_7145/g.19207  ORF Transcript_7145/g.19207 Transcript_7145/m.19207 type:complete len:225 (-) Transcript_7145:407-1081(-)
MSLCICLHKDSTVVPARSLESTTGSPKSGRDPVFLVYMRTNAIMSQIRSSRPSKFKGGLLQEMGIEFGLCAISSTSSKLHMSTLLYTYKHLTYLRLPSMMSMRSSTVMSSLKRISQLKIRYSCKIRKMSLSSRWVKGTVEFMDTPPPLRFLKVTLGGGLFNRMPTDSSSLVRISLWPQGLVASSTISRRSALLQTEITCRPRPLPSLAPSMIPGKSRSWILESL